MAVPYAGYVRTKSRQQAQDERRWGQDRFEGGQDSDTPPVKIATNELALAVNTVCYPDRIEGGYGRVAASDERLPGSGVRHDLKQHPVTGRWLLHRGDKLWISAGRRQREWTELVVLGPDGAQNATGYFAGGLTPTSVVGEIATVLYGLRLAGLAIGTEVVVAIQDSAGPSLTVVVSDSGGNELCAGTMLVADQPDTLVLTESLASGVNGEVDVRGYSTALPVGSGVVIGHEINFSLGNLTEENTDDFTLYWSVVITGYTGPGNIFSVGDIILYKDAAKTQEVGRGVVANPTFNFAAYEDGVIGFSNTWNRTYIPIGTYASAGDLVFSGPVAIPDATSVIGFFGETSFFVWVRGPDPRTVFVEAKTGQYFYQSERGGYGSLPCSDVGVGAGVYKYRYIYTYCRIVNPATGQPDYDGNRVSGAQLLFEGPSPAYNPDYAGAYTLDTYLDYGEASVASPVSPGDPVAVGLSSGGVPVAFGAAAYVTHLGVYRTMDVGVNGAVNNPEIYIWVEDIPIYETEYEDTTSDAVLQNRFSGGALSGENFALRSRFYREMDRGLGAIRPDFMATATPQGTRITYCDVAVNPRFIGYYFPGSQYNLTQDPISDIVSTKDLFAYLCPYSTYTSIAAIAVDTGIQGVSYIPVIQNFERSSQSVGVKYGQRTFPVTDSSFVSLCSDGTVRVYSGTFWGESLDGTRVHKLIELAQIGAVLLYFRDVLYLWYTVDPDATVTDKCLRYGTGGQSGNGWTPVERANWVWPPVGGGMSAVWEQDDATLRMLAIDDAEDVAFAIEDLPPLRQYEDDIVEDGLSVQGAGEDSLANLSFSGWDNTMLYGIIRAVDGGVVVQFFESEADRTADVSAVGMTDTLTEPGDGAEIMGTMPGTVDVLDITPVEFMVVPGVIISGKSQIASPMRIKALAATQQQFTCFHQESYAFFRAVYGMLMPTVAARWYADEVLVPQSVQSAVPPNGDIQSYAQVKGRTIQFELEPQSSGWQLTGINTKYQTQDMRSANGPWNSAEQSLQRELAQGMFSWVLGVTGLINRADGFYPRYSGPVPTLIPGPFSRIGGQYFSESSSLALSRQVTTYSLLFWVKEPVTGLDAAPVAMLDAQGEPVAYLFFPDSTHVNIGSFEYEVPETSEWVCYCVTRSENGFKTYRDGALIGDNTLSPGTDVAVEALRIGAQNLYSVRVYSTVLSSDAVAYDYNHLNQTPP